MPKSKKKKKQKKYYNPLSSSIVIGLSILFFLFIFLIILLSNNSNSYFARIRVAIKKKVQIVYNYNLFDANNDSLKEYNKDTKTLVIDGNLNSNNIVLGSLDNMSFKKGDRYRVTINYISGSYTNNPQFVFELQKDNEYYTDRKNGTHYIAGTLPTKGITYDRVITIKEDTKDANGFNYRIYEDNEVTFKNYKIQVLITKLESKIGVAGEKYGKLPTPEKDGYEFLGWYDSISGGKKITETNTILKKYNHPLYAHWQENSKLEIKSVTASDVIVTIKATKGKNNIAGYYFSSIEKTPDINSYDWMNSNSTTFKTVKFPGKYYVYVKDSKGNISGGKEITVDQFLDTTMLHAKQKILKNNSIDDYVKKNGYYNSALDFTIDMAKYNKKHGLRTRESVVIGAMFFTGKLHSWGITMTYSGSNGAISKDSWGINKHWGGASEKSFLACNPFVIWAFKNAGLNIYGNRTKLKSEICKETREVAAGTEYFKTVHPPYDDYKTVYLAHYLVGPLASKETYGDSIIPRKNGQPGDVLQSYPSSGHDMLIVDKFDDNNDGLSDGYIVLQSRDIGLCYERVKYGNTVVYDMTNVYTNTAGFAKYLEGWQDYYIPTSDYPDYLK